jgi:hypothetical protein
MSNRVAIVLDYESKGIQLWYNALPSEFHPWWELSRIVTLREFGEMYPPDTLDSSVEDLLAYFPLDCGLL